MAINRREAREAVFGLLFETDFRTEEEKKAILETSAQVREFEVNAYIESTYFGVYEHLAEIDALIERNANGWKVSRISRVSRAIMRLCVYEMLYDTEIPSSVSLNEAVELCKKFDDEKARSFLNGVLNAVKNEIKGSDNG